MISLLITWLVRLVVLILLPISIKILIETTKEILFTNIEGRDE